MPVFKSPKRMIAFFFIVLTAQSIFAQNSFIPLYSGEVPNSIKAPANYQESTDSLNRVRMVTRPGLIPFFPAKGNVSGTAVIIFPGGGYFLLSLDACIEIANALCKEGITAFIAKYRLPHDSIMINKSIGPLQDAQAAIQLVRKNAALWGIHSQKIGAMGLSAGGHLVSSAATQVSKIVIDNPGNNNLSPDFIALLYPVIIYDPAIPRTRENLIGKNPSPETLDLYSTDKQVTSQTPPSFLVHAIDDDVIPVKNTLAFFNALLEKNVKTEMHILQSGGHGFALTDLNSQNNWFKALLSWLKENGF
ncbi:alpha/beta hydrolase [Pseudobacter ginsenosidimutans]|uniref:Acetyl esterase/lipase n=1 Tax=Pseudobacter ginsenosidimutans TaxID=661488 RepID=A0A4Q7MYD7_9BACT|nr:alpha/beta hydrolase [Pseudobacter ginsenosidimutans]QEC42875.1 alpha/beta hydrolase [Pseudobacter ginsenosidimutans]RZS74227.1 acetyl esterase/lipase [Pseudobacter ginsenosidimutans]